MLMMDYKLRNRILVLLVLCCFVIVVVQSSTISTTTTVEKQQGGKSGDDVDVDEEKKASTIIDMVKSLLSFPTTTFPTTSNYWLKLCSVIKQGRSYFTPPNLDFRMGDEADVRTSAEGTGEKVKEAVVKSLDKSKATIQDSAKSAANKVKKTLSHKTSRDVETSSLDHAEDEL